MKEGQQSVTEDLPIWESVWRFDKNTVFSYGPWADAQRVLLYDFFFPPEYRNLEITYAIIIYIIISIFTFLQNFANPYFAFFFVILLDNGLFSRNNNFW